MKRLITILVLSILASAQIKIAGPGKISGPSKNAPGGGLAVFNPTLVRWGGFSNTKSGTALGTTVNTCPNTTICLPLTATPQSGNTLVACYDYGDTPSSSPAITDDGGNTWVIDQVSSVSNSRIIAIAHALNVSSSTTFIKINFGAAVINVGALYQEVNNVLSAGAVDQTSSNTSASGSSTVTAGSQTPATANDFLMQCGQRAQTPLVASYTVGSQPSITWALSTTDTLDGLFNQWGQYAITSAINPTMTMASNSGYASVSLSLKTGSQGSPRPTGSMTPIGIIRADVTDTIGNTSPIALQFPCDGANGLVADLGFGMATGTSWRATGITDSNSNTWTQVGVLLGNNSTGQSQMFYAQNPTCTNNMTVSVATTGLSDTTKDATIYLYSFAGASTTNFFRQEWPASGLVAVGSGTPFTWFDPSTPGVSSGCAVANWEQAVNTAVGITSPIGAVFTTQTFGGEQISGGHPPGENNGDYYQCFSNNNQQIWTNTFSGNTSNNAVFRIAYFRGSGATDDATAVDTFTHANVNPLPATVYSAWFSANRMKILSNVATPGSLSTDAGEMISAIPFSNDQAIQVTLSTVTGGSAGSDSGPGLLLRAILANQSAYRIIVNHATGVNTFIEKFVNSASATIVSSSCSKSPAWTNGDILYAQVVGTTITVKSGGSGGSTVCTATDASLSVGSPGLAYSSTVTGANFTNMKAGPSGSF